MDEYVWVNYSQENVDRLLQLKGYARHLLLILAAYMDPNGLCNVSASELAALRKRSTHTIKRAFKELLRLEFISYPKPGNVYLFQIDPYFMTRIDPT